MRLSHQDSEICNAARRKRAHNVVILLKLKCCNSAKKKHGLSGNKREHLYNISITVVFDIVMNQLGTSSLAG